MGFLKRKQKQQGLVIELPGNRQVTVFGEPGALEEFACMLEGLAAKVEHQHNWLSGMICYQIYHSEPEKRYQLMCTDCGSWIEVDKDTFQRYVANELHKQNVDEYKAEMAAEYMPPAVVLVGDD